MSMTSWAEHEVELACKRENPNWDGKSFDYGCSCYQSALKAYNSFMEDNHSGMSYSLTKNILKRLLDEVPLTPIEDIPENWNCIRDSEGVKEYQCNRKSSLFKKIENGNVKFSDCDRTAYHEVGKSSRWHNGFINNLINEMFPIKMPYYPAGGFYDVEVENFIAASYLHDDEDYNTTGVLSVRTPEGDNIPINRYFADKIDGRVEITEEEYKERLNKKVVK